MLYIWNAENFFYRITFLQLLGRVSLPSTQKSSLYINYHFYLHSLIGYRCAISAGFTLVGAPVPWIGGGPRSVRNFSFVWDRWSQNTEISLPENSEDLFFSPRAIVLTDLYLRYKFLWWGTRSEIFSEIFHVKKYEKSGGAPLRGGGPVPWHMWHMPKSGTGLMRHLTVTPTRQ